MFNPFKLYKKSQEVQYNWIRDHPIKYVALNASIMIVGAGYLKYQDYKDRKTLHEMHEKVDKLFPQN
jgi:hypothetical protein